MGDHIDRLRSAVEVEETVALSFVQRVKSYKRTTKTGKVVDVEAYTRTVSKMSNVELSDALKNLKNPSAHDTDTPEQRRMKTSQVVNELRRRGLTNTGETPEAHAARTAANEKAASSYAAKSPEERWNSLHSSDRRAVLNRLAESHDKSKGWAMDDADTAHAVNADKALLRKIEKGESLTEEEYRRLTGMAQALDL